MRFAFLRSLLSLPEGCQRALVLDYIAALLRGDPEFVERFGKMLPAESQPSYFDLVASLEAWCRTNGR